MVLRRQARRVGTDAIAVGNVGVVALGLGAIAFAGVLAVLAGRRA